jgi:hypothetical protein
MMIYLYILGLLVGTLNIGLGLYKEHSNKREEDNIKKTVLNFAIYINGSYLVIVCGLKIYSMI